MFASTLDVPAAFATACERLAENDQLIEVSRMYRSEAVGPAQPPYLNMAVVAEIGEPLGRFLYRCHRLELEAGRHRVDEQRWGPRTLDLDLLMAEAVVHFGPRLQVPHPRFHERAFALVPAADCRPKWVHPLLGRTLRELAVEVIAADPGTVRLEDRQVRPDRPSRDRS